MVIRQPRLSINYLSDTLLEVGFERPLKDVAADTFITTGTVTADIHNKSTNTKVGATITLIHIADGVWRGTIADDHAGLTKDLAVIVKVTVDGGAGLQGYWELEGIVQVQKS